MRKIPKFAFQNQSQHLNLVLTHSDLTCCCNVSPVALNVIYDSGDDDNDDDDSNASDVDGSGEKDYHYSDKDD